MKRRLFLAAMAVAPAAKMLPPMKPPRRFSGASIRVSINGRDITSSVRSVSYQTSGRIPVMVSGEKMYMNVIDVDAI